MDMAYVVNSEGCYSQKKIMKADELEIKIVSKEVLIDNKRASGRTQGLAEYRKTR